MTLNLRNSVRTSINPGIRQSISGGVDALGLFRSSSLDLRFADKKTLTDRVSGNNLITFSRASSGTYVGSDGLIKTAVADAPRFDHDPVTGESLGLLIEEGRTNEWLHSEDVSSWNRVNTTIDSNNALAPDGTQTADKVNFSNTTTNWSIVYQSNYIGTCTWSGWIKTADNSTKDIYLTWGAPDPSSVRTFTATGEWQRFEAVVTPNYQGVHLGNARVEHNISPQVWAGGQFYIWGGQIEAGAFPTSYIPTSGSTVTRSPDIATIEGTNFSSWYNQSEGTIFSNISPLDADSGRGYLFNSGNANQRLGQNADDDSNFALFMSKVGTTSLATAESGMPKPIKACLAYKPGSSRGAIDGGLKTLSTTINSVPTAITQVGLGCQNYDSTGFLNGHIKRLAYFSTRKTDAELSEMTS